MADFWRDLVLTAMRNMSVTLGTVLPSILAMLTLVVLGAVLGWIAWALVGRLARAMDLDQRSRTWGVTSALARAGVYRPPSQVLRLVAFWGIFVIFATMGIDALAIPGAAGARLRRGIRSPTFNSAAGARTCRRGRPSVWGWPTTGAASLGGARGVGSDSPRARDMVAREVHWSVSGALITLEGVEGSGKTTQMMRLERWLRQQGRKVEHTREPDGTRLGAEVRRLFERPGVHPQPLVEVFLFMAARQQHVAEKIRPWLDRGRVVLSDRYADATVAYQGYGRGVDPDLIRELNTRATGGVVPDLTLLFDLDPAEGLRRIRGRRLDRFEREALAFHRRVRRGYLEIRRAEPKRVRLIRAARPPAVVEAEVRAIVEDFFRGA